MHTDRKAFHTKRACVPRPGDVLGPQDHLATSHHCTPRPRSLSLGAPDFHVCVPLACVEAEPNPSPPRQSPNREVSGPHPHPTSSCGKHPVAAAAAAAAKSLQSCPTLCDPIDGSPPGSPALGFSRQEHWSGLPFPSPMHESGK